MADFVRKNEMVEKVERGRELPPVVRRVQDIGVRAQEERVASRLEPLDQPGDRLVEPEDVLPGVDEFVVGQRLSPPRAMTLVGEIFGGSFARSRTEPRRPANPRSTIRWRKASAVRAPASGRAGRRLSDSRRTPTTLPKSKIKAGSRIWSVVRGQ